MKKGDQLVFAIWNNGPAFSGGDAGGQNCSLPESDQSRNSANPHHVESA